MNIAAYCRVSTGSKEQLSSLENQKRFFEEYAMKNGYNLVRIYADRGISGKALKNRREFANMLDDGRRHSFDMLVVKDVSRFARNTVDFLVGIRSLRACGVDVRFLSCNMDTLGESEFTLTMFAAIAQEESYNLSKRIMFGKKVSAQKGRTPSCIYGYDKAGTYSLDINPAEASVVKTVFRLYNSGNNGIRKIASYLNDRHIPSKHGGNWSAKTVRRILSNSIYCGILVNNKTETLDFIESTRRILPDSENFVHRRDELAIISARTYNKAQEILRQKADTHRSR